MPELTENPAAPDAPPPAAASKRRIWWRMLAAVALVALGSVGWHHLVELPAERRAAAELAKKRAANARKIPDLKLDLVWIAPGTFLMGTPHNKLTRWFYDTREKLTHTPKPWYFDDDDGQPATWVTLTRPFWLGRTEVTQAQWKAVMGDNPSHFKGDDLLVETVSWGDAMEFCRKLTERERAAERLPAGYAYTLPTEAQWEYACRAGTTRDYAGDVDAMAWYDKNSGLTTHPVETKQANGWGLSDMMGNVLEWCLDWSDFNYPGGEVTNPHGPASGDYRAIRSGNWGDNVFGARSANRKRSPPGESGNNIGFRVALAPAPQAPAALAVPAP